GGRGGRAGDLPRHRRGAGTDPPVGSLRGPGARMRPGAERDRDPRESGRRGIVHVAVRQDGGRAADTPGSGGLHRRRGGQDAARLARRQSWSGDRGVAPREKPGSLRDHPRPPPPGPATPPTPPPPPPAPPPAPRP